MTSQEIITYMESLRNDEQREILMRFFKTGAGEYGEGDEFLGLKVPQTRQVVETAGLDFPLEEVPKLLMNRWHEVRLCGLLILVAKFEKLATKRLENDAEAIRKRDEIVTMYLQYAEQANNWDLVDLSVHKIIGYWLLLPTNLGDRDYKIKVLDELSKSPCLWKQRMSIVYTWKTSQQGDPSWCLRYAEIHLHHPHDLMHKAVGWMLREMGKRVSMDLLREFLRQHAHEMPRTMLRYAIEKMPEKERQEWMSTPTDRLLTNRAVYANPFAGLPVADFVDIILRQDDNSDKAMYYLLRKRLNRQLKDRYEAYQKQLYDVFEDVVEDFFLYLREGQQQEEGKPYQSLRRIKNKVTFEAWLLNTFRNYLSNRAKAEKALFFTNSFDLADPETSTSLLTDEQKLAAASQLIAYAHQEFSPRRRFIFLRLMLTILNKQLALPDKEMAQVMEMTHLSYRAVVFRIKQSISDFRNRMFSGEQLSLDTEHEEMARHIYNDFTHLYPILQTYYLQDIDSLKYGATIRQLRQEYYEATGRMLHEEELSSPVISTVNRFWEELNRMLIC